jgi:DNA-directed RNA polymerase sigma subunit (sigma70/sigma32)
MLPSIVKYARFAFRHVRGQDRQDLIQETIANAMVAFVRLVRRGRESVAHPSVLSKYAIRQIRDGRRVGNKLRINEMLSQYAQQHKGFPAPLHLDVYDPQDQEWTQRVVEDRTAGPADIACTRIDFSDWLDSLKRRDRRVAEFLANGETTRAAARKFRISQGRISQLRRSLAESWRTFIGDEPGAANAA